MVAALLLPSDHQPLRGGEAAEPTSPQFAADLQAAHEPAGTTKVERIGGCALVGRLAGEDDSFQLAGTAVSIRFDGTDPFEVRADGQGQFRVEVPPDRAEVLVAVHNDRGPDVRCQHTVASGAEAMIDLGTLTLRRSRVTLRVVVSDAWRHRHGPWPLVVRAVLQTGDAGFRREILQLRLAALSEEVALQTVPVDCRDPIQIAWEIRAAGQIVPFSTHPQVRTMDEGGSFGEAVLALDPEMFAMGRLIDSNGKPVVGATLAISSLDDGDRPLYLAKIRTVEEGRFFLPCRRGGHGYVSMDNTRAKERPTAWVAGSEVTLRFDSRDGVRLRVVDAAGKPVERYGFVQRVPGGDEQGRRDLVDLLVRDCPGGFSVVKRERLIAGDVWHVVMGDGTVYPHRITRDTSTEEYVLTLGSPLAAGSLEVRLGENMRQLPAMTVDIGPIAVDGGAFRRIELSASDDPGRVVRSSLVKDGSTSFVFSDLPSGTYKCALTIGRTVVWEQWVDVAAGERAVAVLGGLAGESR